MLKLFPDFSQTSLISDYSKTKRLLPFSGDSETTPYSNYSQTTQYLKIFLAIVGRGKFNKLGDRSQLREAKLEGPWLGIRD